MCSSDLTMGHRIFKLRPIHGFAAETSAVFVMQLAAVLGIPSSTTHCITAAIIGVGATTRLSAVSWGLTRRIFGIWILTLPATALSGFFVVRLLLALGW